MRLDLRDGQWAELRERISHAADKDIKRAYVALRGDPAAVVDIATLYVRTFVSAWSVRDIDGQTIPLDEPNAADRLPDDIADALSERALMLYKTSTDPGPLYASIIGRLALGQKVTQGEIDRLPEPELFRDAKLLAEAGLFTPSELDAMDAKLLALVHKFRNVRVE